MATDVLGLKGVLAEDLPPALGTDDAPDRYSVCAAFTRRPTQFELEGIRSPLTRERLDDAGYRTIELSVSDRRLEIDNTSLEELRDGLAVVIADRLEEISAEGRRRAEALALAGTDRSPDGDGRSGGVAELARSIRFVSSRAAEAS